MDVCLERLLSRRRFLELTSSGIGTAALATLFGQDLIAQGGRASAASGALPGLPHHAPRAKRVIYLFQSGAPSQHELWDYKTEIAGNGWRRSSAVSAWESARNHP